MMRGGDPMADMAKYQGLQATIAVWLQVKFREAGRPIEEPEFGQTVNGLETMAQVFALPNESPTDTLERFWQHMLDGQKPDAKVWDERVTEMENKPADITRVYESSLVSPVGPCESIRKRMLAAGISAVAWQAPDFTGEAIYVPDAQADAARTWVKENIYG